MQRSFSRGGFVRFFSLVHGFKLRIFFFFLLGRKRSDRSTPDYISFKPKNRRRSSLDGGVGEVGSSERRKVDVTTEDFH